MAKCSRTCVKADITGIKKNLYNTQTKQLRRQSFTPNVLPILKEEKTNFISKLLQ